MKIQEVVENLKYLISGDCTDNQMDFVEEIEIAINALERSIPKKPIDDRYPWAICKNCGGSVHLEHIMEHIHNEETSYCEHCGQAIDWKGE